LVERETYENQIIFKGGDEKSPFLCLQIIYIVIYNIMVEKTLIICYYNMNNHLRS